MVDIGLVVCGVVGIGGLTVQFLFLPVWRRQRVASQQLAPPGHPADYGNDVTDAMNAVGDEVEREVFSGWSSNGPGDVEPLV